MLPVLLLGMFDQQISNEKLQKVPQLYQDGIKQNIIPWNYFNLFPRCHLSKFSLLLFAAIHFPKTLPLFPTASPESKR